MIVNKGTLLRCHPVKDMLESKQHNGLVSHGLSEAGYDIRIKQKIHFTTIRGESYVMRTEVDHITERLRGRFALASAIEEFQMPDNLVGVVHDKSTWARQGLSVLNTVIEPGWHGFLTLELVYHGVEDLVVPAGSGIAQVLFTQLVETANYDGKYQYQPDEPVEARRSAPDGTGANLSGANQ